MLTIPDSCVENGIESIPEFFARKSVFITGGTGFLGKVIIEKILYSCPQVENVYILVREKKKIAAQDRMKALFDCPVFNRLREERPEDLQKIVPIAGDIVAPNLGINAEDEELLMEKVSVVIHSAATVRFNEPLKVALGINVEGTRKVLNLCHRMKNVKAFVHVSTAYCNAVGIVVEEKLYPPPMDLEKAYELAKDLNGEITQQSLCGRPNTYTFTKALAESLVKDLHGDIPTAIVRPSIVTPSKREPVEGWVDNWYGATALLLAIGKGYCKTIIGDRNNVLDVIPVDYVSNAILVAAAKCQRSDDVKVFNSCSSSLNPISMSTISEHFSGQCVQHSFNDMPFPYAFGVKNAWIVFLLALLIEVIPAYFADFWQLIRRKPTKYVKIQLQVAAIRSTLGYFTSRSWVMQTGEMCDMAAQLSPADARMFPCNPRDICWKDYCATYYHGVKRYLVDKARK